MFKQVIPFYFQTVLIINVCMIPGKMLNQTVMDGCHDNTSDDVVLVLEDDTSPTKSVQISNQACWILFIYAVISMKI